MAPPQRVIFKLYYTYQNGYFLYSFLKKLSEDDHYPVKR